MTIVVKLTTASIDDALKKIKAIMKRKKAAEEEFIRKLAEFGAQIAREHYLEADENAEMPTVEVIKNSANSYSVMASGKSVCFVEFGTGNYAGIGYDKIVSAPFDIAPGSWSREHGKQYSIKGYWYFQRKLYYGTYPTRGMYYASKEMRANLEQIAKEELSV